MVVRRNYLVQIVPEIQHDLSKLPLKLQENWQQYQKILASDFNLFLYSWKLLLATSNDNLKLTTY